MCFPLMLVQKDRVLNVEMTLIIVKVHILRKEERTDDIIIYLTDECHILRVRIHNRFVD